MSHLPYKQTVSIVIKIPEKARLALNTELCVHFSGDGARGHRGFFTRWCLLTIEYVVKHAAKIRSCSAVNGMYSSATYLEFLLQRMQGARASEHHFR